MRKTLAKKWLRRIITVGLILCLAGVGTVWATNVYVKSVAGEKILTPEQAAALDADCVLVLGSWVSGENPGTLLRSRLAQGVALYESGASPKLLMSGDHGRTTYDEVGAMKQYAIERGVPSQDVFMDHAGFSTYESMYRARDVFRARTVIIVTQEYHLYRSVYIAQKLGLDAYGVAADAGEYTVPRQQQLRETLARSKDFFAVLIDRKPTFLGEAIPVSGNGDLTND